MSLSKTPNRRPAQCCGNCAWALTDGPPEPSYWCGHGVPDDPSTWPDYCDREESVFYNKSDLCEWVHDTEVCDAWTPKEADR